jgi:hypothetical protein
MTSARFSVDIANIIFIIYHPCMCSFAQSRYYDGQILDRSASLIYITILSTERMLESAAWFRPLNRRLERQKSDAETPSGMLHSFQNDIRPTHATYRTI